MPDQRDSFGGVHFPEIGLKKSYLKSSNVEDQRCTMSLICAGDHDESMSRGEGGVRWNL